MHYNLWRICLFINIVSIDLYLFLYQRFMCVAFAFLDISCKIWRILIDKYFLKNEQLHLSEY